MPTFGDQLTGPTFKHLDDQPLNPLDRGGLYAVIKVMKRQRQMVVDFGTVIEWLAMIPDEAIRQAQTFRNRVLGTWGKMGYKVEELPIRVSVHRERRVVMCKMPVPVGILVANPEVFLAWAQRLDEAVAQLNSLSEPGSAPPDCPTHRS